MKTTSQVLAIVAAMAAASYAVAAKPQAGDSPAEHLPPYITQLTWFGERADWSQDGTRILFLSKTFGDAMEIDLQTRRIRNLTAHYPHDGYTRALYLSNGDILLSGPEKFGPRQIGEARVQCDLHVLDKSLTKPAAPLGIKCSEGPAVSRKRMHIAWTNVAAQYPDEMPAGSSRILEADVVFERGQPKLASQRVIIDSSQLPFKCTLETQNFVPPDETQLTFSAYGYQGTEVCGVNVVTGKITNYSNAPGQYDEPEGIFSDGQCTLVECDRQNLKGSGFVDLWKLKLDGSGQLERLTFFSDYPGYKASNPVVSDDGKFIAFQMARSREAAGVGHGIFVYDIAKAEQDAGTGRGATYRVVPDFPDVPPALTMGAVSAVATDSRGNVLAFHRGDPPILIFDPLGKLQRNYRLEESHGCCNGFSSLSMQPTACTIAAAFWTIVPVRSISRSRVARSNQILYCGIFNNSPSFKADW